MNVMNELCHPNTSRQLWLVAAQGAARRKGAPEPLTRVPGESSFSICTSAAEPKAAGCDLCREWVLDVLGAFHLHQSNLILVLELPC